MEKGKTASDEAHRQHMSEANDVMKERLGKTTVDRGLFLILTGPGKGKSSSGFGMVARALGHNMRVAVVQFIKANKATGEAKFFSQHPDVAFHTMGTGFTWKSQDKNADIAAAAAAWELAAHFLSDASYDLVLLDELTIALDFGFIPIDTVLPVIAARPKGQHLVVTGRSAPQELITAADTVSEIVVVKHAFENGIRAQKGIEF